MCCLRLLLCIINGLAILLGGIMILLGQMLSGNNSYPEPLYFKKGDSKTHPIPTFVLAYVVMYTGAVIIFMGLLGFYSAFNYNQRILKLYYFIIFKMAALEVASFTIVSNSDVKGQDVIKGFTDAFKKNIREWVGALNDLMEDKIFLLNFLKYLFVSTTVLGIGAVIVCCLLYRSMENWRTAYKMMRKAMRKPQERNTHAEGISLY